MFCVVGAGLSGCILARHLAQRGFQVLLVEQRAHIGGNCYTYRDAKTGIMLHAYGPHIFHTADAEVWNFIQQFGIIRPYQHRVKAVVDDKVYSFPINLLTINQFFNKNLSPEKAQHFIAQQALTSLALPKTFEEQALKFVGEKIYRAFFEGYTKKQWGRSPKSLPASILKRLPVRFNYNDSYFSHPYQGIPQDGYTELMKRMLAPYRESINLCLNTSYQDVKDRKFDHIFYTGSLDSFFGYKLGRLGYRSLQFKRIDYPGHDYQGTAVMNYCDGDVPFTRITEHKHFSYWEEEKFPQSVSYVEYPKEATSQDIPYYPIRLTSEQNLLTSYEKLACQTPGVSFLGRLGTYRYMDMDVTIREALNACKAIDKCWQGKEGCKKKKLPAFFHKTFGV